MAKIELNETISRLNLKELGISIENYSNFNTKCVFINKNGYKIETTPYNFKGFIPAQIFHNTNRFALNNIKTYLNINKSNYSLVTSEYGGASQNLIFKCSVCGSELVTNWTNFQRYPYHCKGCYEINKAEKIRIKENEKIVVKKTHTTNKLNKYGLRGNARISLYQKSPSSIDYLVIKEDAHTYGYSSNELVKWKCVHCGHEMLKKVSNIYRNKNCKICSNTDSSSERLLKTMFREIEQDFEAEVIFYWSNRKRYDFYIKEKNLLIELNGIQHYEDVGNKKWKKYREQNEIDMHKVEMAHNEGYEIIAVDCSNSDFDFLFDSISNALMNYFDFGNLDRKEVLEKSMKSELMEIVKRYNKGESIQSLSKRLSLSDGTVRNKLIKARKYNILKTHDRSKFKDTTVIKKYTKDLELVCEYIGFKETLNIEDMKYSTLYTALCDNSKTSRGYYWIPE